MRIARFRDGDREVDLRIPECWDSWMYQGVQFGRHRIGGQDVVIRNGDYWILVPLLPYYAPIPQRIEMSACTSAEKGV
jgi:hypothetical protein